MRNALSRAHPAGFQLYPIAACLVENIAIHIQESFEAGVKFRFYYINS